MPEKKGLRENNRVRCDIDELKTLTENVLKYVEKRDLSRVFLVMDKRKRVLNQLRYKSADAPDREQTRQDLQRVQTMDASLRVQVETELAEVLDRIATVKKRLRLKKRFVGPEKKCRKIIDGKL